MDSQQIANPEAEMKSALIAGAHMPLIVKPENYWKAVNLRRPKGCDCLGCKNFKRLPSHLHESADIFCRNSFEAWRVEVENLITTEGKNDILTQYLKGSSYTAAFYVALVDNASFTAYAVGDTAAQIGGSNGWAEAVPYSNATRVAWTGGTASGGSVDNSGSVASFTINATKTIRGAFLVTNSTKSGTTGKIYGEADFGSSRSVLSGDTLQVTVTATMS